MVLHQRFAPHDSDLCELCGLVRHHGHHQATGHYIADIKHFVPNSRTGTEGWQTYDDARVTPTTWNGVQQDDLFLRAVNSVIAVGHPEEGRGSTKNVKLRFIFLQNGANNFDKPLQSV